MAKIYTLDCSIWLPGPPAEAFLFFADAHNLESITPSWLHFEVVTPRPILMKTGALIDYRLKLHGISLKWRTEIAAWEPPRRFVDEQLRGPYHLWRHTHTFEAVDRGTLVRDHVEYSPRGGALIHRWFVRPDLLKIFAVRQKRIAELMGKGGARIGFAS